MSRNHRNRHRPGRYYAEHVYHEDPRKTRTLQIAITAFLIGCALGILFCLITSPPRPDPTGAPTSPTIDPAMKQLAKPAAAVAPAVYGPPESLAPKPSLYKTPSELSKNRKLAHHRKHHHVEPLPNGWGKGFADPYKDQLYDRGLIK